MDFHQFFGFIAILKESIKLLRRNGKLMALVTTLSLIFSSIFFLIFNYCAISSFSLTRDMLAKESFIPISSSSYYEFTSYLSRIKDNLPRVLTIFFGFVFCYYIVTFLSMLATVIVSAESYNCEDISLKDLSLRIVKSWTRPLCTGFYTTIFVIGYVYFVISMASPLLISSNLSNLGSAVLFGLAAYVVYLYLSTVWILSLVVSVVDEGGGGIAALGKSAEIIKGQKLNGFLLNIVFNLVSFAIYLCSNMMINGGKHWISDEKISGLLLVNGSCLVRILTFVAYTVLYFQGKEGYGQEIELQWSNVEYAKLGVNTPFVGVP